MESTLNAANLRRFCAILIAVVFSGVSAQSQVMFDGPAYFSPVPDYTAALVSSSVIGATINSGKTSKKTTSPKSKTRQKSAPKQTAQKRATSAQLARLSFTPDAARTRKNNEKLAQKASQDPKKRAQILSLLNSGKLQNEYDKTLAATGLSSKNIADTVTAFLIANWQIYHGQDTANRAGVDAQKKMMQNAMALNTKVQSMSDAQKQELAEALQLATIVNIANYQQNQRTKNQKNTQQLRQSSRQELLKWGLDVQKVKLTNQGFQQ